MSKILNVIENYTNIDNIRSIILNILAENTHRTEQLEEKEEQLEANQVSEKTSLIIYNTGLIAVEYDGKQKLVNKMPNKYIDSYEVMRLVDHAGVAYVLTIFNTVLAIHKTHTLLITDLSQVKEILQNLFIITKELKIPQKEQESLIDCATTTGEALAVDSKQEKEYILINLFDDLVPVEIKYTPSINVTVEEL